MEPIGITVRAKAQLQELQKVADGLLKTGKAADVAKKELKELTDQAKPVEKLEGAIQKLTKRMEREALLTKNQVYEYRNIMRQFGEQYGAQSRAVQQREDFMRAEEKRMAAVTKGFKRFGAMILGGGALAFALRTVHTWADINKELVETEAMFGRIEGSLFEIGQRMGYTKQEIIEINRNLGSYMNTYESGMLGALTGYARVHGVPPASTVQMAELWRLTKARPEATDRFLILFEQFSKDQRMNQGRIEELIRNVVSLGKLQIQQVVRPTLGAPLGVAGILPWIFRGTARGELGPEGMSFLQRLNAAMVNPVHEAIRAFQMRAFGVGRGGTGLVEFMRQQEKGIFGQYGGMSNLYRYLQQAFKEYPRGGDWTTLALHAAFGQRLSIQEIDALKAAFVKTPGVFKDITKETWEKTIKELRARYKAMTPQEKAAWAEKAGKTPEELHRLMTMNWEELAKPLVSEGEQLRVSIENLQYTIGEQIGPPLIGLLKVIADGLTALVKWITGEVEATKKRLREERFRAAISSTSLESFKPSSPKEMQATAERMAKGLEWAEGLKYSKTKNWAQMSQAEKESFATRLGTDVETLSNIIMQPGRGLGMGLQGTAMVVPKMLIGTGVEAYQNIQTLRGKEPRTDIKIDVGLVADPLLDRILQRARERFREELPEMMRDIVRSEVRKMEFDNLKSNAHKIAD